MSVDTSTLEQYSGKQVILHTKDESGDLIEREGKVEAASEFGMAFKEKGKRDSELVEPDQIEEIALAPTKPKKLAQKKLKPVTDNTVRQHLLDRHGLTRTQVNELSDEQAWDYHDELDHSDLGHRHVEPDDDDDENESDSEE